MKNTYHLSNWKHFLPQNLRGGGECPPAHPLVFSNKEQTKKKLKKYKTQLIISKMENIQKLPKNFYCSFFLLVLLLSYLVLLFTFCSSFFLFCSSFFLFLFFFFSYFVLLFSYCSSFISCSFFFLLFFFLSCSSFFLFCLIFRLNYDIGIRYHFLQALILI